MPTHTPPQLPGAVVIRPTPVAQGLPDVESTVLLFLSDGHTCEGYYDGTHWRDSTAWPIEGATVQAWAHLPTMKTLQAAPALAADLMAAAEYLRMDGATLDSAEALRLAGVLAQLAGRQAAVAPPTADRISTALAAPGCERLRDFYDTGPAQRASVETFAAALGVSDPQFDAAITRLNDRTQAAGEVARALSDKYGLTPAHGVEGTNGPR